ncbi:MAG: ATP-binding protein [Bacteroidetes bacterium]|nr:ATP-binding protein [Bacteroidota bacterium]
MKAKVTISTKLLLSISSLYEPIRVLLEFVDNAIDAAETFFTPETKSYSKKIEISVSIDGDSYEYARIEIKDNCTGIRSLEKLFSSVGNSSKVGDNASNGEFGFGVMSHPFICSTMKINSKHSDNDYAEMVKVTSEILNSSSPEGAEVEITKIPGLNYTLSNPRSSGVWITLEDFHKETFKELKAKAIKSEIEKHFEDILRRENISITVIDFKKRKSDEGREIFECTPFDYESYEGITFERTLHTLEYIKSKRYSTVGTLDISATPVKIYLRIFTKNSLGRLPVFTIKGRRIKEVSEIKNFKSNSKIQVWSNNYIGGSIDVTRIVEPDISRTGFKQTLYSKALFHTLLKLEPEIKEAIASTVSSTSSSDFKKLENVLENALIDLTQKQKRKRKRKSIESEENNALSNQGRNEVKKNIKINVPIYNNSDGIELSCNSIENLNGNPNRDEFAYNIFGLKGSCKYESSTSKKYYSGQTKPDTVTIYEKSKLSKQDEAPDESTDLKTFKLDGLGIRIDKDSEPILDENGKALRSTLLNGKIVIFMQHPLFQERLISKEDGFARFTFELITYIAAEVITQYTLLRLNEKGSDINTKFVLQDYVESLHGYIQLLKKLEGKKLSELTS